MRLAQLFIIIFRRSWNNWRRIPSCMINIMSILYLNQPNWIKPFPPPSSLPLRNNQAYLPTGELQLRTSTLLNLLIRLFSFLLAYRKTLNSCFTFILVFVFSTKHTFACCSWRDEEMKLALMCIGPKSNCLLSRNFVFTAFTFPSDATYITLFN